MASLPEKYSQLAAEIHRLHFFMYPICWFDLFYKHLLSAKNSSTVHINTNTKTVQVSETIDRGLGYITRQCFLSSPYIYSPSHQLLPGNLPKSWENLGAPLPSPTTKVCVKFQTESLTYWRGEPLQEFQCGTPRGISTEDRQTARYRFESSFSAL